MEKKKHIDEASGIHYDSVANKFHRASQIDSLPSDVREHLAQKSGHSREAIEKKIATYEENLPGILRCIRKPTLVPLSDLCLTNEEAAKAASNVLATLKKH